MNEIILTQTCEYFTRYGDGAHMLYDHGVYVGSRANAGSCDEKATLALANNPTRPMICVCRKHAERIVERFPELGTVEQRFIAIK